MKKFSVRAGNASHDVIIGPLEDSREQLAALATGRKLPLVSDDNILGLWGERLRLIVEFDPLVVPHGETAKSWDTLIGLIDSFKRLGVGRTTPVIALGGGSIGDVAGLAAAIFKRGCPVIHIPTTLLAQVDSAIGGKTAIDAAGQKNLVGAFHAPALVVADPSLLSTLDLRQLRAGYAEMVKYALIEDPMFFAWCESNGESVIAGDEGAREFGIEHSLRAKAQFVAEDFHDREGRRALLNFGHTFGHAIESAAGIGTLLHGEAVAIGMQLALRFSVELGLCPAEEEARVSAHFESIGLPGKLADAGLAGKGHDLLSYMLADKKAGVSGPVLILTRGIGQAFASRDVPVERLTAFLNRA